MSKTACRSAAAAIAFLGISVVGPAHAAPVFTPNGDPFPAGATVTMTPVPGPTFSTPFGAVASVTLSDFVLTGQSFVPAGAANNGGNTAIQDILYSYNATFSNDFLDGSGNVAGSFSGTSTDFQVQVFDRTGTLNPGDYTAQILSATFQGNVVDITNSVVGTLTTLLDPSLQTTGTVSYGPVQSVGGNFGQFVDTTFDVNGGYDDGSGFNPITLLAQSTPPITPTANGVPLPATLPLVLLGLMGLRFSRKA